MIMSEMGQSRQPCEDRRWATTLAAKQQEAPQQKRHPGRIPARHFRIITEALCEPDIPRPLRPICIQRFWSQPVWHSLDRTSRRIRCSRCPCCQLLQARTRQVHSARKLCSETQRLPWPNHRSARRTCRPEGRLKDIVAAYASPVIVSATTNGSSILAFLCTHSCAITFCHSDGVRACDNMSA